MMIRGKSLLLLCFLAFLVPLSTVKSTLARPLPLETFKINTSGQFWGVTAPALLTISRCQNVTLDSITIESPNTDGIHLSYSRNVVIINSDTSTGENCISIGDHVQNVTISHDKRGPGQGTRAP